MAAAARAGALAPSRPSPAPVAASPTLSVVVPATNAPATLDRCLDAILAADDAPEQLVVVKEPAEAGPAGARNIGARRATGDVLVFVDADVVVHPDALGRIRAAFRDDPGLTALFGAYDDAPASGGLVSAFRNLLHHHVHHSSAGPAHTFWAGLGAVRREAFLSVGGFDAARFRLASVEDVELGMRLAARGARIELDPGVAGTHLKGWSLWDMVKTDYLRRGVPWVTLLLRSRTPSSTLNLGWRHRMSAVASLAGVGGALLRRPALAAAGGGLLVVLNHSFYALLARRYGLRAAATGVVLHCLHHIVSSAALPTGLAVHLLGDRRGRRS